MDAVWLILSVLHWFLAVIGALAIGMLAFVIIDDNAEFQRNFRQWPGDDP